MVAGHLHEHALSRTSKPLLTDSSESTTIRPTIIDFISRIKKRSAPFTAQQKNQIGKMDSRKTEDLIEEIDDSDCPCSADLANIRDGIAEHTVFANDNNRRGNPMSINHELNESELNIKRKKRNVPIPAVAADADADPNHKTDEKPKIDSSQPQITIDSTKTNACPSCSARITTNTKPSTSPETCSRDAPCSPSE